MPRAAESRPVRPPIGRLLVEEGLITEDQLDEALAEQRDSGERLGQILVRQGHLEALDLTRVLARHFKVPFVDLEETLVDPLAAQLVPEAFCRRRRLLPVASDGELLVLAMVDPLDVVSIDDVKSMTGLAVTAAIADPTQLLRAIDRAWVVRNEDIQALQLEEDTAQDVTDLVHAAEDAPVVALVNQLIAKAVGDAASDIHFEPTPTGMRIRFRVDGALHDVMLAPRAIARSLVTRIKVMAEMDIAEHRIPLDGRLTLTVQRRTIDARVVTLPTTYGESVVLRLLDRSAAPPDLAALGLPAEAEKALLRGISHATGATLVTGPTGSGKTSTLYAALTQVNQPDRNIITVEDPVEYLLPGIKQIQVNRKAGRTFAGSLRAILRADPDVIMVGEIRDTETARIAAEAALTGHLVLSTLHTNDAASTPARLLDMGIEPYLVSASLRCIVAQRLLRRLCDACKQPATLDIDALVARGWDPDVLEAARAGAFEPVGCARCRNTGYAGRFVIAEVLPVDDDFARLIVHGATAAELRNAAHEAGMTDLRADGLRRVASGTTSIEELARVLD